MKVVKLLTSCILIHLALLSQGQDGLQDLRLNQIQVIGSHNSYKKAIDPAIYEILKKKNDTLAKAIDYSHISIIDQLNMGLCNLEIDVYADAKGGKYAHPKGLDWEQGQSGVQPYDLAKEMLKPGFKIFHIQEIDFRSHYLTFESCLKDLKKWSDEHPNHQPIFITMNAKDQPVKDTDFSIPEPFTSNVFDELDRVISAGLGERRLITPDQVKGKYKSLETAVLAGN
jgi:hypothetical protein